MKDSATLSLFERPAMIRDLAPAIPSAPLRTPRPYQIEMRDRAVEQLRAGARSTLAVMPTGSGKTFAASLVIRELGVRTLWLNERDNLVRAMREDLSEHLRLHAYIEQGPTKAPMDAHVVVGSVQSMIQDNRLASYPRDHFGLIVTDEAHHLSAGYEKIYDHFSTAKLLGLTATPIRQDRKSMATRYEGQCADLYMGDLVADGWLVGPEIMYGGSLNLNGIKKSSSDFTDDQIAQQMTAAVLGGMVTEILEHGKGMRGVVYMPRVDMAHAIAGALNIRLPGSAMAVDGRDMERYEKRAIIAAHKRGDFLYLVNDSVVVEGHDDAGIELIAQGRPTKSIARYIQELGRATRPRAPVDKYQIAAQRRLAIAESIKPTFRVLDFVGLAGMHDTASPIDAMAGGMDDEETRDMAREIFRDRKGGPVGEALSEARARIAAARKAESERIARIDGARWNWSSLDAFKALGLKEGPTDVATALNAATQGQRAMLRRFGVEIPAGVTSYDAQRMIKAAFVRKKIGLADYQLVAFLSRHGIMAQRMYQVVAERCRDAIRQNNGRTPPREVIEAITRRGRVPGED